MESRVQYEEKELSLLAPYAMKSKESLGRIHPEKECPMRTAFQRDMSRIVHSTAFRRLEYKTQVFVNHEGDYFRTRLTHTLEVSQIARGVARILGLNEDLAMAISFAHDLGHTPFGHPGEIALNKIMKDDGGFEHNIQSYRVVTELEERYPDFKGLNLSYEVLEGIVKHSTVYDTPKEVKGFKDMGHPTLEAQIVNLADEIAFMNHDLDDGLQCGMLTIEALNEVKLWAEAMQDVNRRMPGASDKVKRSRTVSYLIGALISDAAKETKTRIAEASIKTLEDVRKRGKHIVSFSDSMKKKTEVAKAYLFENLYHHWRVVRMAEKAGVVINDLFLAYTKNPRTLPNDFFERIDKENAKKHICDYIAGMTDRFAIQEHKKLFDPDNLA